MFLYSINQHHDQENTSDVNFVVNNFAQRNVHVNALNALPAQVFEAKQLTNLRLYTLVLWMFH